MTSYVILYTWAITSFCGSGEAVKVHGSMSLFRKYININVQRLQESKVRYRGGQYNFYHFRDDEMQEYTFVLLSPALSGIICAHVK